MLLGRLIAGSRDVIVDEVTEPQAQDRSTRFSFFRARNPSQRLIDLAWDRSAGTRIYLGEWHTHPEPDPTPSCKDRRNWRRIVRRGEYAQDSLSFVILGQRETRVWEVCRGSRNILIAPALRPDRPPSTAKSPGP